MDTVYVKSRLYPGWANCRYTIFKLVQKVLRYTDLYRPLALYHCHKSNLLHKWQLLQLVAIIKWQQCSENFNPITTRLCYMRYYHSDKKYHCLVGIELRYLRSLFEHQFFLHPKTVHLKALPWNAPSNVLLLSSLHLARGPSINLGDMCAITLPFLPIWKPFRIS